MYEPHPSFQRTLASVGGERWAGDVGSLLELLFNLDIHNLAERAPGSPEWYENPVCRRGHRRVNTEERGLVGAISGICASAIACLLRIVDIENIEGTERDRRIVKEALGGDSAYGNQEG